MGSPQSRRKRKRTFKVNSGFHNKRRLARMVPFLAVLISSLMMVAVWVRHASRAAMGRRRTGTTPTSMPLAVLLEGQHEISSQAAIYADRTGRCLALEQASSLPPQHLGPFTCVADALFLTRALALTLKYVDVVPVDVGSPPSWVHGGPSVTATSLLGRSLAQELNLRDQGRVAAEGELPAVSASVIFVSVHEERTTEVWMQLIQKWLQVTGDGGLLVIHSQQGLGWGSSNWPVEGGREGNGGAQGSPALREAVTKLACGENDASAAVGDLDGGVVLIRHGKADASRFDWDCGSSNGVYAEARRPDSADAQVGPQPLQFEKIFLWATGDYAGTGTIASVQANFGGVDAVHNNALRRIHRAACFSTKLHAGHDSAQTSLGETKKERTKNKAKKSSAREREKGKKRGDGEGDQQIISVGATDSAVRKCLVKQLGCYPNDVRALFAIEMIGQAASGKRRSSSKLRQEVLAESGTTGNLLWRALHAHSATVAAAGITA